METMKLATHQLAALPIQTVAIGAKPVTHSSRPALVNRYVAPRRTSAVVVIDAILLRLDDFVDRVEVRYAWHRPDLQFATEQPVIETCQVTVWLTLQDRMVPIAESYPQQLQSAHSPH